MWDLRRLGIELMSPALVAGFFTTEPPENPVFYILLNHFYIYIHTHTYTYTYTHTHFLDVLDLDGNITNL